MEHRTQTRTEQRQRDVDNNACFTCHTIGCGPWKQKDGKERKARLNNVYINKQLPSVTKDIENDAYHSGNE